MLGRPTDVRCLEQRLTPGREILPLAAARRHGGDVAAPRYLLLMPWTIETMGPLLRQFDERVRRDVSSFSGLIAPAASRGSVLRDPASEIDVQAVEERLGVRLPPSYRAFVLISDGAYASALGAELDDEGLGRHGLVPVSEVQRTIDGDELGVSIWCDRVPELNDPANDSVPVAGDARPVTYYSRYRDGLLISHIWNGTSRLALVPRPGNEEWALWDFHWEGAFAHPSFADFIQWYLAKPDQRPRPELADDYVATFTAGRAYTLDHLAEVGDPRAQELAAAALRSGSDDQRIPALLAKLGDPQHIPLLRETYERSHGWIRVAALDALDRLGAEETLAMLVEVARDPDERVRNWAQHRLDEHHAREEQRDRR